MNGKLITTLVVLILCVVVSVAGILIVDGNDGEETPNKPVTNETQPEEPEETPEEQPEEPEEEPEEEKPAVDLSSWELLLVNNHNPLPDDFEVETEVVQGSFKMDARIAETVKQMIADAKEEGVDLMICSAYRSIDRQKQLFAAEVDVQMAAGKTKEEAEKITATMIAVPGTSEHHTGLSADIVTPTHQTLDEAFAETAAGKWLVENAPEYGFILRYPKDKQDITEIIYESWHFRYVGVEHAKAITEQGLCLEEYIEQLKGEQAE